MKKLLLKIILATLSLWAFSIQAQNNMAGKEFWLGFLNSYYSETELIIQITSEHFTSGTVSIPLQNWDTAFSVSPGNVATIYLPLNIQNNVSEVVANNGVYISAKNNISVVAGNHATFSTDASVILPIEMLKTDYFGIAYTAYGTSPSDLLIVATHNNTTIEITPSVNTFAGKPAKIPFEITLQKGQSYLLQSSGAGDISGTKIVGKNILYPFAVFGGVIITNVPAGCFAADHLYQQMYPVNNWGKEYLISPVNGTFAMRVMAAEANTVVTINNNPPITLNEGEHLTLHTLSIPQYLNANKPIAVAQYLQSLACGGAGDPAMIQATPIDKPLKSITFSTFHFYPIDQHFISLAIKNEPANKVYLNGNLISGNFTPFPHAPQYSYRILQIKPGVYTLSADSGFIATAFGVGDRDSYFLSLGVGECMYNPVADFNISQPSCVGIPIHFAIPGQPSSALWNFGDGNAAQGSNTSHTYDTPGIYNVQLITYGPEKFCSSMVNDTIEKFVHVGELPSFSLFKDTTLCGNTRLNITAEGAQAYLWANGDTAATVSIGTPGKHWLKLINGGCFKTDTFLFKQVQYPSLKLLSNKEYICSGETAELLAKTNVGMDYQWSTGETTKEISITQGGYYSVTGSNFCGSAEDSIYMELRNLPVTNISLDSTILLGTNLQLFATGGVSYSWSPPTYLSCTECPSPIASPEKSTTYSVTIKGSNGCFVLDSVTVFVDPDLHIYMPNVFSPNGDGINDVWFVRGKGIQSFQLNVYNRWGEKVFESVDIAKGWDGTVNGKLLNPAVFVYVIDATLVTGQRLIKKGDVALVR
jgi:gliding motility-associated-like protein